MFFAAPTKSFNIVNQASSAYLIDDASNAAITVERGATYVFAVNASGHPFYIKTVQSTGTSDVFSSGVTNNGAESDNVTFVVPSTAPDVLYYACSHHVLMTGVINVINPPADTFVISNIGSTAYSIDGITNPALTLERGLTYVFSITAGGHPFWLKTVQSTGQTNSFSGGVIGNGLDMGTIIFVVPQTAPDTLFYNCEYHNTMAGTINVVNPPREVFEVVNNGASSYSIDGSTNPTLTLQRGLTYAFNVVANGHPFWIKTTQSTGQLDGVTGVLGNGVQNGLVYFTVANNVSDTLYYNCEFHGSMSGVIKIVTGKKWTLSNIYLHIYH